MRSLLRRHSTIKSRMKKKMEKSQEELPEADLELEEEDNTAQ